MALGLSLLIASLLARFGTSQQTASITSLGSLGPIPTGPLTPEAPKSFVGCSGCYVAPAFTEATVYGTNVSDTTATISMIFTAYSTTSTLVFGSICVTTSGDSSPIDPPFTVSISSTANSASILSAAASQFYSELNICNIVLLTAAHSTTLIDVSPPSATPPLTSESGTQKQSPSTSSLAVSSSSRTSSLSTTNETAKETATIANSPLPSSSVSPTHTKIIIGVTVPIVVLALLLTGFLLWYRRRKTQRLVNDQAERSPKDGQSQEDTQPYLQRKAELEADEKRKHELEAREVSHEIGSGGERYEMAAEERGGKARTRQELRDEEHSCELEVPR